MNQYDPSSIFRPLGAPAGDNGQPDAGPATEDAAPDESRLAPMSLGAMRTVHTALRPVLVENLLRVGETLNLISASKIGKSWAVYDLIISMAAGLSWFGMFQTEARPVLLIDNELHPENIAYRIPKVAIAKGVDLSIIDEMIQIQSLRGKLMNLLNLRSYLKQFRPGHFGAIIIDAWYRTLPPGTDENDNGAMANLYNIIDQCADDLQTSFVLVHHSSKGNQAAKAVTDVGSGAGTMARATDTHLVMRRHEEKGAIVMEAAVRSFAPVEPICFRWNFPIWTPAPDLDPNNLAIERKRTTKAAAVKVEKRVWTIDGFVAEFVKAEPKSKGVITIAATLADKHLSERRASQLLKAAIDTGKVFAWKSSNPAIGQRFATSPQPLIGGEK